MKGKWAAGIQPRNFIWVIKDRLAISERPGGYGRSHRRVRRQEEMVWLRENGFSRVVSVLPSPHNMAAYEEFGIPASHVPFGPHDDPRDALPVIYEQLRGWLANGERLLLHGDEDRMAPVENAELIARLIPGSRVVITPGGRHGFFDEFRDEVSAVVRDFLG